MMSYNLSPEDVTHALEAMEMSKRHLLRTLVYANTEEVATHIRGKLANIRRRMAQITRQLPAREPLYLSFNDEAFYSHFRFRRADVSRLAERLHMPSRFVTANRLSATGEEALLILLFRLARPQRHLDASNIFQRHKNALCTIYVEALLRIHDNWMHLLGWGGYERFPDDRLQNFRRAAQAKSLPLTNLFGFIDGTLIEICRPGANQGAYFSGHRHAHAIRFQAVVGLDGIMWMLSRWAPGSDNDAGQVSRFGIVDRATEVLRAADETQFYLFGDHGYRTAGAIMTPYTNTQITNMEPERQARCRAYNTVVHEHRVLVENSFQHMEENWRGARYTPVLRVGQTKPHVMYRVAVILRNCHVCLYGWQHALQQYNVHPPTLEEYLRVAE